MEISLKFCLQAIYAAHATPIYAGGKQQAATLRLELPKIAQN